MDQNQPYQDPGTSLFQLNLDATNSYTLRSSASWAKVLGVVGIILGTIFLLICVLAFVNSGNYYDDYGSYRRRRGFFGLINTASSEDRVGLWIMILTSIVFIVGGIFSFSFGNKIGSALKLNSQDGLNNAFAALRNYFALRSITLIIVLLLFLIAFAGSI